MAEQNFFIRDVDEITGSKKPAKTRSTRARKGESKPQVYDCNTCGLKEKCKHPKIKRFGKGCKGILFIGLCPGRTEDKIGMPLVGASGDFLRRQCEAVGLNIDDDCIRTNIVQCYPGKDKRGKDIDPTDDQIRCCRANIFKDIEETKPKLIICLGTPAIQTILESDSISAPTVTKLHGKVFPYHKLNCWVASLYHPSFFLHRKNDENGIYDDLIFTYDLASITSVLNYDIPKPFDTIGNKYITSADEAVTILKKFTNSPNPTAYDYETSHISPYEDEKNARLLFVSLADNPDAGYCIPVDAKDRITKQYIFSEADRNRIKEALKDFIISSTPKVFQNYAMEELWGRRILGVRVNNLKHDTMIGYHVLNNRTGCNSLDFQVFELTGHEYKNSINVANIENEDPEKVHNYSSWDSRYTIKSYMNQRVMLNMDKKLSDFNDLLTRSLPTLVSLKERGIRIDVKALDEIEIEFVNKMKQCVETIKQNPEVLKYETSSGKPFNPEAANQWCKVLYEGYKEQAIKTDKGNWSADEDALNLIYETTQNPEVKQLLKSALNYRKYAGVLKKCATAPGLSKQVGEYRRKMASDGKIHPNYNLHTTSTYRSSVTDPNSQNVYKHDPECLPFRRSIIPEPGQLLLEGDYKALEVRIIAMASGDMELARQIISGIDMHKKYAGKLFMKPIPDVTDDEKYRAKNLFVFPSFYMSKPNAISKNLGMPRDFITVIQNEFWEEFHGVREWQLRTIQFYNKNGYIEGLSGYRVYGPLSVYQIVNSPIQGTAFHLLLNALTLTDEFLIKNDFKSRSINEIHDANLISTDPTEIEDVMKVGTEIMVKQYFDWQTVPLAVAWDMGANWYEMEKV